jgi:ATP-dependent RNA circularization protein (DNA/RNA ligase family)
MTELENFIYDIMRMNEIKEMPMHIKRKVYKIYKSRLFDKLENEMSKILEDNYNNYFNSFANVNDISLGIPATFN